MTIKLENFRKLAEGKKVRLFNSIRTKFSNSKLGNFVDKVNKVQLNRAQKKVEQYDKEIKRQEITYQKWEKNGELTENLKEKYEQSMEFLKFRRESWLKKVAKYSSNDIEENLEYEAGNIWDYFPDLTEKEEKRLQSYYDENTQTFKIGREEINPNVEEEKKEEVYSKIVTKFREVENTENMRFARSLEEYGIATCGEDFIRFYSTLGEEQQTELNQDLRKVYDDIEKQIGIEEMRKINNLSSEETQDYLSTLNLPNIREKVENIEIKDDNLDNTEKVIPIQQEKDEYTLAIEEAQEKQEQIKAEMENLRKKHNAKLEGRAQTYGVWEGDLIADNYDILAQELAPLKVELEQARQAEKNAFDARRQEKIEADKKARAERLAEINKKAAQEAKSKAASKRLEEAKKILSNFETSTGKFDISNLTDEEILETYDTISNSISMAERITKAREEVEKTSEINQSEPTVELEKIAIDPDEVESTKTIETNSTPEPEMQNQDVIVNKLMDEMGLTEEQARAIASSGSEVVQTVINEFSAPKIESQGKTR